MLRQIGDTITATDVNIYPNAGTLCTIPSDATQARICRAYITLTGLVTTGGTYTISLLANGTTYIAGSPADLDLSTTLEVSTYKFWTDDFIIPAGETFVIKLKSPNSGDSEGVSASTIVYDSLPVSKSITRITGGATNIEEMIVQLWTRFFGKVVLDKDNSFIYTYDANDVELTKQSVTISGNVETVGEII